jgi:hypothetical protein
MEDDVIAGTSGQTDIARSRKDILHFISGAGKNNLI